MPSELSEPSDDAVVDDPSSVLPAAEASADETVPPRAEALTGDAHADDEPPAAGGEQDEDAEQPVPSEAELERTAVPATVRRAPKFSAFITFGALGGMVVGLLLAVIIHPSVRLVADGSGFISFLDGEGAVRTVMVVAVGVLGAFVGGALAVRADRRSGPPRRRAR